MALQAPIGATRRNTVWLDSDVLSGQRWGRLDLASAGHIALDGTLTLQEGGQLALTGSQVSFGGTVQIAGGQVERATCFPYSAGRRRCSPAIARA